MKARLKKLKEQVMVITGASSGIGLTTARKAGKKGVKLVLCARSSESLHQISSELRGNGCEVLTVVCDVCSEEEVRNTAQKAIDRFGRIDTWVNNAGVSIYGRALEVPVDDERKLFETNFWGTVYGSKVAIARMRAQGGGCLINLGSVVSDRAFPLQGAYSASKAAIKAYTDTLRMEVEEEGIPVSITLIQPASIATPWTKHARNYMDEEPRLAPPVYAPDLVADAILHAAETPTRHLHVGGAGRLISSMNKLSQRGTDVVLENMMFDQQRKDHFDRNRQDNLWEATEDPSERGEIDSRVMERSFYTAAAKRPIASAAVAVGVGLAVAALLRGQRSEDRPAM